jgi:site-specific recombinase XerD
MRITLAVPRTGTPATHPLSGREMRELRRHQQQSVQSHPCLPRTWDAAIGARVLPHHPGSHRACGYKLANDGHDTRAIQAYLGHRNIQKTTRYTALAP